MVHGGTAKRKPWRRERGGICKHNVGEHYNAHFILGLGDVFGSDEDMPLSHFQFLK